MTTKNLLQALEEAQLTGSIEIKASTVKILVELEKMGQSLDSIIEIFQDQYTHDNGFCNEIQDNYFRLWIPLREEILKGWLDYVKKNTLDYVEFEGL